MVIVLSIILYETLIWIKNIFPLNTKIKSCNILLNNNKLKTNTLIKSIQAVHINRLNFNSIKEITSSNYNDRIKPPNILIYSGKNDSKRIFEKIKDNVSKCLNIQKYTIYHLQHEKVKKDPWVENISLLIIASDKVYDEINEEFFKYFVSGGKIISFSSDFEFCLIKKNNIIFKSPICNITHESNNSVAVICGKSLYSNTIIPAIDGLDVITIATEISQKLPIILSIKHKNGGAAIISRANLEQSSSNMAITPSIYNSLKNSENQRSDILKNLFETLNLDTSQNIKLECTPLYIYSTKENIKNKLMKMIKKRLVNNCLPSPLFPLKFNINESEIELTKNDNINAYQVLTDSTSGTSFNIDEYRKYLGTSVIGNLVFYAEIISSTMDVFDSLMLSCPDNIGLLATAKYQLQGKGRGGNDWLSPVGCAMFTFHLRLPLVSKLSKHISCIQHIVAIAAVQAAKSKIKDLDICIKWPNDIYFGRKIKLGGIIVKSSAFEDHYHLLIGCGVNVSNSSPTTCINDIIISYINSHNMYPDSRRNEDADISNYTNDLNISEDMHKNIKHNLASNIVCDTYKSHEFELKKYDFNHKVETIRDENVIGCNVDYLFTMEEYMARLLTQFEILVNQYELNGPKSFQQLYTDLWLHTDEKVSYKCGDHEGSGIVRGIDPFGFLLIETNDGLITVQPDGNSFDIMRNLVYTKT